MPAAFRPRPLILRAVSRLAVGGVQRGILATLRHADRAAFDYAVLCTKKEGDWADDVRAMGVPVHWRKTLPPWHPFQIARLARTLRRLCPDLIHIHMAPMVIPVASAALLAGNIPYVIHHHSLYTRFWAEQNRLLFRWERWLTRRARVVIAVSEAAARCSIDAMGLDPARVVTIPNGIEPADFAVPRGPDPRPGWGLAPETPLVYQVSRYLPTKRIEDFIEAAAIVLGRWPSSSPRPAFVVIGGGGHPSLRAGYEALIAARGLRGQVILAGTRSDLPPLLGWASVGVLASENEGFGQVILEYLAAGLPVAATDLPAVAAMVRHEREALLSPPRRPDLLANHIERLLHDRSLAVRLVDAGRQRLAQFSWERAARAYEAIYRRVLAGDAAAVAGAAEPLAPPPQP